MTCPEHRYAGHPAAPFLIARERAEAAGFAPMVTELPDLLDRVRRLVTRYVVLPSEEYADSIALWVAHAHAIRAATASPRLVFKSPEKASGKTRALEVIEPLVPAPLNTVNASVAAVFRLLKEEQATLLFDEVDSIFSLKVAPHEELRALLNAGYRKGATVARVVGEGKRMRVERFPVFAATALAAIGNLPETIESRAILVPMRPRAPDEPLEPFRLRKVVRETDPLRVGLAQWAQRYEDKLREHEPCLPAGLTDRLGDSWEPLLAIADFAGDDWAARARAAAQHIAGGHVIHEGSLGVQLLGEIRSSWGSDDRIPTAKLLAQLNALEEAPWGGWHDGTGMTPRDLARILKRYGIVPKVIRLSNGSTARGYLQEDFGDAWQRYLPPAPGPSVTSVTGVTAGSQVTGVTPVTSPATEEADGAGGPSLFDEAAFAALVAVSDVAAPTERNSGSQRPRLWA